MPFEHHRPSLGESEGEGLPYLQTPSAPSSRTISELRSTLTGLAQPLPAISSTSTSSMGCLSDPGSLQTPKAASLSLILENRSRCATR